MREGLNPPSKFRMRVAAENRDGYSVEEKNCKSSAVIGLVTKP